jgi:NADPH:quinone reductase-like Zn-dependent oxidoreductase
MKAIVWTKYGPPEVLQLQEVEKPAPKDNQVLVRIHAATVTAGDCEMRSLKFPLWLALPMRLYAGIVRPSRVRISGRRWREVERRPAVKRFKAGGQSTALGLGWAEPEYCCGPRRARWAGRWQSNDQYELQAAATPVGGLEALHFLRRARSSREKS